MDIQDTLTLYKKDEIQRHAYDLAYKYEKEVHYCPQACFAALSDVFHIKDDTIFRSIFGFHGGGGDSGIGMCGGLVGGIVAISYFFGRTRSEFNLGVSNCYTTGVVKYLVDEFSNEFGRIRCRDCQKKMFGKEIDFWNEDDVAFFEKENGHEDKCSIIVGRGAFLAAGILWDELRRPSRIKKEKYSQPV